MNNVVKRGIVLLITCFSLTGFAQTTSEKLKKEQTRLEKRISDTRSLLDKTKSTREATLNELQLIEKQIKFREQLVSNFDNQVRGAEMKIIEKGSEVKTLQEKLARLKNQYRKLLIYAYKHRNRYGKLMFVFSANNYNEAVKRTAYLRHISEIQKKQFLIIRQHQHLIREEISTIEKERRYKLQMLKQKSAEKASIENDKKKQEVVYGKIKQQEGKLLAQLQADERQKEVIRKKIDAAIKKEIAAEEAKRKKAEQAAAAAAAAAAKKKKEAEKASGTNTATKNTSGSSTTTTTTETTAPKTVNFEETKESAAMSRSFEGNKGKLPWPVEKGTITENYGRNPHPTLENVYTNNNGIDISTPANAQVRAVFDGEVTSVLNIPGAGKVVIIKHGNYRTVYSNLQSTYVQTGTKVSTKQAIGSLLVKEGTSISVMHFEIHQVAGSTVQSLNPSLWVTH